METKIYEAALKGDVESLEGLIREDELVLARVSISFCFSQTPLHLAAMLGHFDFAKLLLHHKPDFASRLDSQGRSPLHLAAANGYVNLISLLLQEDLSMCLVRDEDGRTPLHLAVMNGQYESIHKLVEAKPEVNSYTLDHGETILHSCVIYNRLKPLVLIMESVKVDEDCTNVKDESGNTILHSATALKQIQHVRYLLTRSEIRVNEVNGNGLTALDIIDEMPRDVKSIEIKQLLILAGGLRANELKNKTNQLPTEIKEADDCNPSLISEEPSSNTRAKLFKKVKKWRVFKKKGKSKGDSLLVAATVIAAMAYQAAVSPPGGVIGMDANDIKINVEPGTSILAHYDPHTSKLFWIFNTISFITSLSIIFLIESGVSTRRKLFIWALRAALWIIVSSMTVAYLVAAASFIPGPNKHHGSFLTLLIAAMTWDGLVVASIFLLMYYVISAALSRVKKSRVSRNIGRGVLAQSTSSVV